MNQNSLPKDTDTKFKEKMYDGWNICIECKAKGRGYEMTYEGHATKGFMWEATYEMRHAVGNTLDEVIDNLFNNPVVHEKKEPNENLKSAYKAAGGNPIGE